MSTSSHLQRVSAYTALVAEALDLDADVLRAASRLHDVGMAGVPDAVVSKPGPLTPQERREMQEHTELGHTLLSGSGTDLLDTAAEIAWTHHERWDGHGYPRGLAGEDIPLSGRVVAVVDAFDALTTHRPYRSAGTVEDAVETLRAERGHQFDPDVVDALLARLDDVVEVLESCPAPPSERTEAVTVETGVPMTLQAAAATLAITPSRLRRWADEGRITAVRTAGGHRRFPIEAVRRLAAERGVHPNVRPVTPPETPLPLLSQAIIAHGQQMAAAAATAVYREGPPGWFASDAARPELDDWLQILEESCRTGVYAPALQATDNLMRRAYSHAASLLERHAFLERFGQVAMRTLVRAGADRPELTSARRLFTALQQALLQTRD